MKKYNHHMMSALIIIGCFAISVIIINLQQNHQTKTSEPTHAVARPLNDYDNDSVDDGWDNCFSTPNSDQADINYDTVGDACDFLDGGLDTSLCYEASAVLVDGDSNLNQEFVGIHTVSILGEEGRVLTEFDWDFEEGNTLDLSQITIECSDKVGQGYNSFSITGNEIESDSKNMFVYAACAKNICVIDGPVSETFKTNLGQCLEGIYFDHCDANGETIGDITCTQSAFGPACMYEISGLSHSGGKYFSPQLIETSCSTENLGVPSRKKCEKTYVSTMGDLNTWLSGPQNTTLIVQNDFNYDFNGAGMEIDTECGVEFYPQSVFYNTGSVLIAADYILFKNSFTSDGLNPSATLLQLRANEVELKPTAELVNKNLVVEAVDVKYQATVKMSENMALCGETIDLDRTASVNQSNDIFIDAVDTLSVSGSVYADGDVELNAGNFKLFKSNYFDVAGECAINGMPNKGSKPVNGVCVPGA